MGNTNRFLDEFFIFEMLRNLTGSIHNISYGKLKVKNDLTTKK